MILYCIILSFLNNFNIIKYDFLTLCCNILNELFINMKIRLKMNSIFRLNCFYRFFWLFFFDKLFLIVFFFVFIIWFDSINECFTCEKIFVFFENLNLLSLSQFSILLFLFDENFEMYCSSRLWLILLLCFCVCIFILFWFCDWFDVAILNLRFLIFETFIVNSLFTFIKFDIDSRTYFFTFFFIYFSNVFILIILIRSYFFWRWK